MQARPLRAMEDEEELEDLKKNCGGNSGGNRPGSKAHGWPIVRGDSQPPDSGTNGNWTGSITTTYGGEVTTVKDQAGKQRRSTVDGLGRLIKIEEMNEAPANTVYATTNYGYDG